MPYIILIDKYGKVKEQKIKKEDDSELYKKAGFKKEDGFSKRHTWEVQLETPVQISLYGKTDGSAGRENKFEFPPPVDNALFFGTVVLVKTDASTNAIVDLNKSEWKLAYETLFGGFEDLNDDEEEDDEEEEEEVVDPTKLTRQGYLRDDFVVDDEELEYESELSEEEYFDD
jgi:hypothetical protein